jgi:hypothetical protein
MESEYIIIMDETALMYTYLYLPEAKTGFEQVKIMKEFV